MKYLNPITAILLALLYATGKIPPTEKYNLWITSFVIPVALVINHILLIIFVLLRRKSSLYYFASLLIGIPYLFGTVGVKHFFTSQKPERQTFTVLSYNTGGYRMIQHTFQDYDSARLSMKEWLLHSNGDIKCYQEFTNYSMEEGLNVIKELKDAGVHYYFSHDEKFTDSKSKTGTLILSKFPIISSGDVMASRNGFNRIAYVDIKVDTDTIRVVNVHLESMGLYYHRHRGTGLSAVKANTVTIWNKLKVGVVERSNQVKQLAAFISTSPYPVICAGDFNDMPYSYSYQYLKKRMKNTFEESGAGFGFTYNGGKLKFLRIDNQFYSEGLRSTGFETLRDVRFSDHFPVRAEYTIVQ